MDLGDLSNFELRQICYFMVLVESGNSFSEAARRVGIKQGPFSQRIQDLEDDLSTSKAKVELFDRSTRPATLTEAGSVFLKEAEGALIHLKQAIAQARQASQGEVGHLTVGVHNSAANSFLPKILKAFRRHFPAVALELREVAIQQEISLLKECQIDLVFHRLPSPDENDSNLAFVPILQESFLVAVPETHYLARLQQISVSDLKNEPIILPSLDALPFYKQVIRLCQKAGFEPKIVQNIKATGSLTLLSLVAAEIGVSILPSHVQILHREGVVYRPLQENMLGRQVALVYRKTDSSIVLQKFLQITLEVMKLPREGLTT